MTGRSPRTSGPPGGTSGRILVEAPARRVADRERRGCSDRRGITGSRVAVVIFVALAVLVTLVRRCA
jgi:hypothetical protein